MSRLFIDRRAHQAIIDALINNRFKPSEYDWGDIDDRLKTEYVHLYYVLRATRDEPQITAAGHFPRTRHADTAEAFRERWIQTKSWCIERNRPTYAKNTLKNLRDQPEKLFTLVDQLEQQRSQVDLGTDHSDEKSFSTTHFRHRRLRFTALETPERLFKKCSLDNSQILVPDVDFSQCTLKQSHVVMQQSDKLPALNLAMKQCEVEQSVITVKPHSQPLCLEISNSNFIGCQFDGNFHPPMGTESLKKNTFNHCTLAANFNGQTFKECDFSKKSVLSGDFTQTVFNQSLLTNCNLTGDFTGARFAGTTLQQCRFNGTFTNSHFKGATLIDCDISGLLAQPNASLKATTLTRCRVTSLSALVNAIISGIPVTQLDWNHDAMQGLDYNDACTFQAFYTALCYTQEKPGEVNTINAVLMSLAGSHKTLNHLADALATQKTPCFCGLFSKDNLRSSLGKSLQVEFAKTRRIHDAAVYRSLSTP